MAVFWNSDIWLFCIRTVTVSAVVIVKDDEDKNTKLTVFRLLILYVVRGTTAIPL